MSISIYFTFFFPLLVSFGSCYSIPPDKALKIKKGMFWMDVDLAADDDFRITAEVSAREETVDSQRSSTGCLRCKNAVGR